MMFDGVRKYLAVPVLNCLEGISCRTAAILSKLEDLDNRLDHLARRVRLLETPPSRTARVVVFATVGPNWSVAGGEVRQTPLWFTIDENPSGVAQVFVQQPMRLDRWLCLDGRVRTIFVGPETHNPHSIGTEGVDGTYGELGVDVNVGNSVRFMLEK